MKRIVFLDYLRVVAIFMVIIVHACEQYYFNSDGCFYIASASDAVWVSVIDSAVRSCVPLFVMVSSFLLFPINPTLSSGLFLKRRICRVLIPFAIWAAIYTFFWNGSWGKLAFNFPMEGGHLWFVPMIIGLYLLMPLLSPWAEKVEKRELRLWLWLWGITTLFPYARGLWRYLYGAPIYGSVPYLWGECPWNTYGTFYYISGFFGYLLLGLYFRRFAPEKSWGTTLAIALPIWIIGFVLTALPFLLRIPAANGYPTLAPYSTAVELEMSWEYCALGQVLMTIAIFSIFRKISFSGVFYRFIILPLSNASFGVYLLHMFVLVSVVGYFKPALPTPIAIMLIAVTTFISASVISLILRRLPLVGKWICG